MTSSRTRKPTSTRRSEPVDAAAEHAEAVAQHAEETAPEENTTKGRQGKVGEVWVVKAKAGQRVDVDGPLGLVRARGRRDGSGAHVALLAPGDWSAQPLTDSGNASGNPSTITAKD